VCKNPANSNIFQNFLGGPIWVWNIEGGEPNPSYCEHLTNCFCPACSVPENTFEEDFKRIIEFPYNLLVPEREASVKYKRTATLKHNEKVLVEETLLKPSDVNWPTDDHKGLFTIMLIDTSIRNNHSVIQWAVTNVEDNKVSKGDEILEYVTPVAWRNCYNGLTNHGEACEGEGLIYEEDYVHNNVLYVFKQRRGRIEVEDGERNSGCQLNLQSTISNTGTWSYENLLTFVNKYDLEVFAGTWFSVPYSDMVGKVLCRYHKCYGNLFSAFLAPSVFPDTLISLEGITDLDECGPKIFYEKNSDHPLSLDSGDRDPINWSELYGGKGAKFWRNKATKETFKEHSAKRIGKKKVGSGFQGIKF